MKLKVPIEKEKVEVWDHSDDCFDCSGCMQVGKNTLLDEISQCECVFDLEKMVTVIAEYHIELGKRIVRDGGKNEKVSPSRELAKTIILRMPSIMAIKRNENDRA